MQGVSILYVHALLDGARDRGLDAADLLLRAGIEPGSARVPTGAYAALMRHLVIALEDEFFGQDSRRMKPGSFAMLCHAVLSCRDLRRALARALRFYSLLLDDVTGQLIERGGVLRIELHAVKGRPQRLFAHENLLLFLHRLSCWLINRRIPIEAMDIAFARPDRAAEYKVVFALEPAFDQPVSAIAIDARFATLPVVRDEAALKEFLVLAPENLFVRYRPTHGTAHLVRRHLTGLPLAEWPDFTKLARALGMSASTLHRRLAADDSSFQAIKDQIRRERAMTLLRQTDRSVMTIAEELGFAEPSAFHRAFRKWSGRAPGQYRRDIATQH